MLEIFGSKVPCPKPVNALHENDSITEGGKDEVGRLLRDLDTTYGT